MTIYYKSIRKSNCQFIQLYFKLYLADILSAFCIRMGCEGTF